MKKNLASFEKKIGIVFKDKVLLTKALTHRSYVNENNSAKQHNERLEFLGDAVLELTVTEYLFKNYQKPEGELTNWRAALVNSKMLASVAKDIHLGEYLFLSKGEAKDYGRARNFILANAFEALLGAIYLDQGMRKAKSFVKKVVLKRLPQVIQDKLYQDPKSYFQECAQEKLAITPHYEVLKEWGPDHQKEFRIGAFLEKKLIAKAEGASKHIAEKKAARKALQIKKWN
jgi:ribonuclease III